MKIGYQRLRCRLRFLLLRNQNEKREPICIGSRFSFQTVFFLSYNRSFRCGYQVLDVVVSLSIFLWLVRLKF